MPDAMQPSALELTRSSLPGRTRTVQSRSRIAVLALKMKLCPGASYTVTPSAPENEQSIM